MCKQGLLTGNARMEWDRLSVYQNDEASCKCAEGVPGDSFGSL